MSRDRAARHPATNHPATHPRLAHAPRPFRTARTTHAPRTHHARTVFGPRAALRREYSTIYAGASVAAAAALTSGAADIAINWMGGQAHARRDCAAGFSYVNDVVLAIVALLRAPGFERVMFVNLDAWHASGVEEAFFTTDRVLCLSLHRYGDGLFPGSGGAADVGEGDGKHHTVNVPVTDGFDDADAESTLLPILQEAAERFQPHAIVCCAGAGVIAGDRLGCLNMTLESHTAILKELMALERPMLVLGSAGYAQLNAARTWCNATAALCGVELPEAIPAHLFREDYLPEYKLAIPRTVMHNKNTAESLEATKAAALLTVSKMPAREPIKPAAAAPTGADGSTAEEAADADAVKPEPGSAEAEAVKAEGAEEGDVAPAMEEEAPTKEEAMDVEEEPPSTGNGTEAEAEAADSGDDDDDDAD